MAFLGTCRCGVAIVNASYALGKTDLPQEQAIGQHCQHETGEERVLPVMLHQHEEDQ